MRVQFDLRPAGMVEKERKKSSFNLTRLVAMILMMAFFITSIGYIVVMTMALIDMRDQVDMRETEIAGLNLERAALAGQVTSLQARETVFVNTLAIMNDDLPTIEVLAALETHMDEYGIGFETLRFAAGRTVEVTGLAATDRQIIDFSERLRFSGVFSDVALPVTSLNAATGMISFTLRMVYLPIGEIRRNGHVEHRGDI